MKQFQIWENTSKNPDVKGILIPTDKIYKVVDMCNLSCLVINGVDVIVVDDLNRAIANYVYKIDDVTEMEEFLVEQGIEFTNVEWMPNYPQHQELLYFDTGNQQFDDLSLCDYTFAYEWWNGSNHKTETVYDDITVTNVDTEDNVHLDLDEWDQKSSSFCTGGVQFYHEIVYKIVNLDGEKVDNMFLVEGNSQWQGSHPEGVVITKDELDKHLKEIGYIEDDESEDEE